MSAIFAAFLAGRFLYILWYTTAWMLVLRCSLLGLLCQGPVLNGEFFFFFSFFWEPFPALQIQSAPSCCRFWRTRKRVST